MKVASIILARGGSKGVPNKNKMDFCGKPLISWTIEQCIESGIDKSDIFVSSDSLDILEIGYNYGVGGIFRHLKSLVMMLLLTFLDLFNRLFEISWI